MQPGQTISPNSGSEPPTETQPPAELPEVDPAPPTEQSESAPITAAISGSAEQAAETSDPATTANWQYTPASTDGPAPATRAQNPIQWSASEFIEHDKRPGWFMVLGIGALVVAVIIYFVTRDIIAPVAIGVAALLFGVVAARKPRTLEYAIDNTGVHIDSKSYGYDLFKSFSVLEEGALSSIQLAPLKRFMPPLSLYYPPEQEDEIVATLGDYLPHEDRQHDPIDRLMRRVRF
jgi:hypothetical protein